VGLNRTRSLLKLSNVSSFYFQTSLYNNRSNILDFRSFPFELDALGSECMQTIYVYENTYLLVIDCQQYSGVMSQETHFYNDGFCTARRIRKFKLDFYANNLELLDERGKFVCTTIVLNIFSVFPNESSTGFRVLGTVF
jgi:hypothetical protein